METAGKQTRDELLPHGTGRGVQRLRRAQTMNWKLMVGLVLVIGLILFGLLGPLFVDRKGMRLGSGPFSKAPTSEHIFGTDSAGRDLFTMIVYGTLPTLVIGVVAGGAGTIVGVLLGLITGYYHGWADTVIRTLADIMLAIPTLLIMVVIASYITTDITTMALIIAIFSWPWTARTIRSQTLSLRERPFVEIIYPPVNRFDPDPRSGRALAGTAGAETWAGNIRRKNECIRDWRTSGRPGRLLRRHPGAVGTKR